MLPFLSRWRRNRQAESELRAMSDRELADLGILRCDIARVVRGGARAL